jgi:uncharacterized protein YdeI (YjbR/CyaY-like superfamily)
MPAPRNVRFFATPRELRAWFEANHETADELWLGYHSKRSGRQSITWQEVVDQELCFGWIDSVRYPYGEHVWAQRITPRRARSVWSAINIKRFGELEAMGLVHPAGRAAFARRDEGRSRIYSYENASVLDAAAERAFRSDRAAWKFFNAQPPSYRRIVVHWIMTAKRDETRRRRLETAIAWSRKGERVPPWRPPSPRSPSRGS